MNDYLSRVLHLSRSLAPVISPENERPGHGTMRSERVARAIIAEPQDHIDALVEAGVLESWSRDYPRGVFTTEDGFTTYRVVAPHVHDWRWNIARPGWLVCASSRCAADLRLVDNPASFLFTEMPTYDGEVPS